MRCSRFRYSAARPHCSFCTDSSTASISRWVSRSGGSAEAVAAVSPRLAVSIRLATTFCLPRVLFLEYIIILLIVAPGICLLGNGPWQFLFHPYPQLDKPARLGDQVT